MATKYADIHVKVDSEVKEESEKILAQIGISMSDLINMTLRRVNYVRDIPFNTSVGLPREMIVETKEDLERILDEAANTDESKCVPADEAWAEIDRKTSLIKTERRRDARVHDKVYA